MMNFLRCDHDGRTGTATKADPRSNALALPIRSSDQFLSTTRCMWVATLKYRILLSCANGSHGFGNVRSEARTPSSRSQKLGLVVRWGINQSINHNYHQYLLQKSTIRFWVTRSISCILTDIQSTWKDISTLSTTCVRDLQVKEANLSPVSSCAKHKC